MDEYADSDDEVELRESLVVSLRVQPHRGTNYAFDLEPTTMSGNHLFINGLPSIDEEQGSPEEVSEDPDSKLPDDVREKLVRWCDDADAFRSIENQIETLVTREDALWNSICDFSSCDRINVQSLTITNNGAPRYQVEFRQQHNTDTWEITHDITEGPIDLELAVFPSQAPVQEARMTEGLIEYWRLAPLSEEPESDDEYRNDPLVQRHRYHLYRSHSMRLFKGLVRDLEIVSLYGATDQQKYNMDSLSDPYGNDGTE